MAVELVLEANWQNKEPPSPLETVSVNERPTTDKTEGPKIEIEPPDAPEVVLEKTDFEIAQFNVALTMVIAPPLEPAVEFETFTPMTVNPLVPLK